MGNKNAKKSICFCGHCDVVPVFNNWSKNYKGEIVGDRVYGRGAVDMLGGVVCWLCALQKLSPEILEKVKRGELTTLTDIDKAKKEMLEIAGRDNSVKDLLNKYLTTETEGLRVKLKELSHMKEMKKISEQEFNANALAILQIISKNTKLNEEEKKLYNRISSNNLSSFQEDKGIDQSKLEKNLNKQK